MTESELKERKLRLEDAINATAAAVEEGVVPGGGIALMQVYRSLKGKVIDENKDVQKGIDIVLASLSAPLHQIATNAGYEGDDVVEVVKGKKADYGFDAKTGTYLNMIEGGIIDPTKVTKSALLNAASISALFVTTEAVVSELPKKEAPAVPAAPDMGY